MPYRYARTAHPRLLRDTVLHDFIVCDLFLIVEWETLNECGFCSNSELK